MKDGGSRPTETEMKKVELKPLPYIYPMPAVLVGANVDGKPNYCAVAYTGVMDATPPVVYVALSPKHHTTAGIRATGTYSINFPPAALVAATDYCGTYSGRDHDKSKIFESFYGRLGTAPLVAACPLGLECKVIQTIELQGRVVFVAEIAAAYADEAALTDGQPDVGKMDLFVVALPDNVYLRLGERLGGAWEIGADYEPPR